MARRAALEDDLAALAAVEGLDFSELIGPDVKASAIDFAVRRVASIATGRLQITKEMRELDDRLGLTPKAMAALRWTIADDSASPVAVGEDDDTLAAVHALHAVS